MIANFMCREYETPPLEPRNGDVIATKLIIKTFILPKVEFLVESRGIDRTWQEPIHLPALIKPRKDCSISHGVSLILDLSVMVSSVFWTVSVQSVFLASALTDLTFEENLLIITSLMRFVCMHESAMTQWSCMTP